MVPMKSRTKSGKRFSTMLALTALISCSCGGWGRMSAKVSARGAPGPSPVPPPGPGPPGHLVGNIVDGEVMQGGRVVTVQQSVQEGPAVPVDRRLGLSPAASCCRPHPSPAPPGPASPTSGRWDRHSRCLWAGSPSHTASSSAAGSRWAPKLSQSAGGGVDEGKGGGVNQVFIRTVPPTLPPPRLPPAQGLTAVRVGKTQSNMSHPRATQTTRSVA